MIELAIVSFLAGLGLFFVGLQTLTDYLKILTNKKVRELIIRFTKTAAQGIFLGGILISVTQSLSALVFTLIGMARAKAIEVKQALPIIIGGNIFAGFIIFLISFDIKVVILLVLGLSAILFTSVKSKKYTNYFGLIFGLALLFFGLFTMQTGVSPLIEMPWMQEALIGSQGKYIAVFIISALISLIIHSAMATIIIGLALTNSGLLSFQDAMMLVYGANVGSSVLTFILSAKITGKSKQVAMFQGFYNFLGALVVIPLFILFNEAFKTDVTSRLKTKMIQGEEQKQPRYTPVAVTEGVNAKKIQILGCPNDQRRYLLLPEMPCGEITEPFEGFRCFGCGCGPKPDRGPSIRMLFNNLAVLFLDLAAVPNVRPCQRMELLDRGGRDCGLPSFIMNPSHQGRLIAPNLFLVAILEQALSEDHRTHPRAINFDAFNPV